MNFVNVGRLRANAPPSLANASTRARTTRDDARRDVRVAFDAFAIASRATIRDAREDEDERQNSPRPAVSSARSRDAMALDDDDDAIEDMLAHCDASAEYTYVDLSGRTQGPFDEIALARWHLTDHLQRAHVVRASDDGRETTVGDIVDAARARAAAARARGDESAEEPVAAGEVEADGVDAPSALDDRLSRLLAIGGGTLPQVAPEAVVGARPGTEETEPDAAGRDDALGITLDVRHVQLEKYKRPKTWRDILSATRERVKKGRAAMSTPMAEDGTTNEAWSRDVATDARDPRPDLSALDAEDDEEGVVPEEPKALELREPFWVIEDRERTNGALDAEGLNAAVAEQLRNTSKTPGSEDARSDRSDVSWSRKPGGAERQAAAEAEAAELEAAAQRSRAAAVAAAERASGVVVARADQIDEKERARLAAEEERRQYEDMMRYFAANPFAGQWWLPDDERGGEFSLGPFSYDELVSRLPHVMVAHRREDDAWRVVGPYAARDRVENYGRVVNGAVVSLGQEDGEIGAAADRKLEVETWFEAVTSVLDVETDVKDPFPRDDIGDRDALSSWFDREIAKVKVPVGTARMSTKSSHQRKRRRGFEMRVVADERQNAISARVLGDLYQAVMKNRKRLFASIIEPVLKDWERHG